MRNQRNRKLTNSPSLLTRYHPQYHYNLGREALKHGRRKEALSSGTAALRLLAEDPAVSALTVVSGLGTFWFNEMLFKVSHELRVLRTAISKAHRPLPPRAPPTTLLRQKCYSPKESLTKEEELRVKIYVEILVQVGTLEGDALMTAQSTIRGALLGLQLQPREGTSLEIIKCMAISYAQLTTLLLIAGFRSLAAKAIDRSLRMTESVNLEGCWRLYLYQGVSLFSSGMFDEAEAILDVGVEEAREFGP